MGRLQKQIHIWYFLPTKLKDSNFHDLLLKSETLTRRNHPLIPTLAQVTIRLLLGSGLGNVSRISYSSSGVNPLPYCKTLAPFEQRKQLKSHRGFFICILQNWAVTLPCGGKITLAVVFPPVTIQITDSGQSTTEPADKTLLTLWVYFSY